MIRRLPTIASILISEQCNLRCTYCFEAEKRNLKMSNEVADKTVDYMFDNAEFNRKHGLTDNIEVGYTFFGGEPCLNFEGIKRMLDRSIERGEKSQIPFFSNIITNGTIITDEMVEYFKKHAKYFNFSIQLSVDGLKEDHDYYRIDAKGNGSFDRIEKNLPKFKEIFGGDDFVNTNRFGIHLHGSLNKKTLAHMYEAWKFFRSEWGIPVIWYMPIHSEEWTQEDVENYQDQLTKISDDIIKEVLETNNRQLLNDYAPLNKCLTSYPNGFNKPCGAGDSYMTVTARGDIYPCHQFYYNAEEDSRMGNIYDGIYEPARNMFLQYDASDLNCSKEGCDVYNCYRCIADNYTLTGSVLNCPHSVRCQMSRIEKDIILKMRNIGIQHNIIGAR